MKTPFRLLAVSLFVLGTQSLYAQFSGEINRWFYPGDNLFQNPLNLSSAGFGTNMLRTVIPEAAEGTTVSLWDATRNAFSVMSTFTNGGWWLDLALPPGTGAKLTLATNASWFCPFVGEFGAFLNQ